MSPSNSGLSLASSDDLGDQDELSYVVGSLPQWPSQQAPTNTGGSIITSGPVKVTYNITNHNLLVYKAIQNNTRSSGFLGYNTMSSNGRHGEQRGFTNLPNGALGEPDQKAITPTAPSRESTPEGFLVQPPDWFRPGRFFRIWARGDLEIHNKQFILLDSKNIEGKGVRVDILDSAGLRQLAASSGANRTIMSLKCCRTDEYTNRATNSSAISLAAPAPAARKHSPHRQEQSGLQDEAEESAKLLKRVEQKKLVAVYLEEHQEDHKPDEYIQLEHTYNIPFKAEYKYDDLGMLEEECLRTLQVSYIAYLASRWNVVAAVKEKLGEKK